MNINEVTAKLQEANPTLLFGIAESKGLIAIAQGGEWVLVMSAAINGQWVYLDGSLPLVNGERVYSDADFTAI